MKPVTFEAEGVSFKIDGAEIGTKADEGKARYDLIPPMALEFLAHAFSHGAKKYDDDNWHLVPNWKRRYFAACMRHMWAYWRGDYYDNAKPTDSGLPHLACAAACVFILLGREEEGEEKDAEAEPDAPPRCFHCQSKMIRATGNVNLRDIDAVEYRCRSCDKTFYWHP